jgi:hypothetical protein
MTCVIERKSNALKEATGLESDSVTTTDTTEPALPPPPAPCPADPALSGYSFSNFQRKKRRPAATLAKQPGTKQLQTTAGTNLPTATSPATATQEKRKSKPPAAPDADFPPPIGTWVAYEDYTEDSPRPWQLGRVTSVNEAELEGSVEMYGCNVQANTNLLTAKYRKARWVGKDTKGREGWVFDDDQTGSPHVVPWQSVFVLDVELDKHSRIMKEGQMAIQSHLESCTECQAFASQAKRLLKKRRT